MKTIYEDNEVKIISNKEPAPDKPLITFTDGSSVNLDTYEVINKGPGEIIIRNKPMWPSMDTIIQKQERLFPIKHIHIEGGMNNVLVVPSDGNECFASIRGADKFAQECDVSQCGDSLYIRTPKNKKRVYVNTKSVWVNGRRKPPKLDDDFGYVEIKCNYLNAITFDGWGVGNIICDVPVNALRVENEGSSCFDIIRLKNAEITSSGSGNVFITELDGSLYGRISGSGDIHILSGYISHADVNIKGSGNLLVSAPIQTAELSHSGSGSMILTQILGEYTIKKTGSGIIRVLKSGTE